jgi:hypothetical protein
MIQFATGRLPGQMVQSGRVHQLEGLSNGRLRLVLETRGQGTLHLEVDPAAHWLVRRLDWRDAQGVGYRVETAGVLSTAQGVVIAAEARIHLLGKWEPILFPVEPKQEKLPVEYRVNFTKAAKSADRDLLGQIRASVTNPLLSVRYSITARGWISCCARRRRVCPDKAGM